MLVIPTVRRKQPWPLILRKPSCIRMWQYILLVLGALVKLLQWKNKMINCDIRDTVSSIAITGHRTMLPGTLNGMTYVCHFCHFCHALALDEWRVRFLPKYTYGGSAKPVKPIHKTKGMWAVIQLVICTDPKLVQSLKEHFHTQWQRRLGLQGCTQICKLILTHKLITNIQYLVGVEI